MIGDNYSFYTMTGTVSAHINGFGNGISGRLLYIINNTTKNQTFTQETSSSSASNRFTLGGANQTIGTNHSITFLYVTGLTIGASTNQARWVKVAHT